MENEAGPSGPVPSLHDDFLQTFHEVGMYNYAEGIDLIQDGQLAEVRMHGALLPCHPQPPFSSSLMKCSMQRGESYSVEPWVHSSFKAFSPMAEECKHAAEDMRMWPMEEACNPAGRPGLSEEELREGELRIEAANSASEQAICAAEEVKVRERISLEADPLDDLVTSTPGKHRKLKKGGKGGASEYGGRSNNKGLRHFSMKVCEKVEGKGRTTYNEVADELVNDLPGQHDPGSPGGMQYDEKNIRRRVYDALNVLMAMGIISRERKEIFWKGLPQGPQLSLDRLRGEKHRLCQKLDQQRRYIAELTQQQVTYRSLMDRNRGQTMEQLHESNAAGNTQLTALPLPFVLIQVDRNATVEIKISEDNRVAHFDFERMPFKFTGDEQVLQEMGLANIEDALTVRAYAAAGEASSPRLASQQAPPRQGGAGPSNSRAHPALPPPAPAPLLAPLQPMHSPKGYMSYAPPTSAPHSAPNGLGVLGSVAAAASGGGGGMNPGGVLPQSGGMSPAWRPRPSGGQQAALMQHMQQAAMQQRGLGMPLSPNMARPIGNQQIPGAQPYRSPQQSSPSQQLPPIQQLSPNPAIPSPLLGPRTQLPSNPQHPRPGMPGLPPHSYGNVATSMPPGGAGKSILSMPMGPTLSQGLSSGTDWGRLDPTSNHAMLLHSAPGAQMLPNIQPLQTRPPPLSFMMQPGQPAWTPTSQPTSSPSPKGP